MKFSQLKSLAKVLYGPLDTLYRLYRVFLTDEANIIQNLGNQSR